MWQCRESRSLITLIVISVSILAVLISTRVFAQSIEVGSTTPVSESASTTSAEAASGTVTEVDSQTVVSTSTDSAATTSADATHAIESATSEIVTQSAPQEKSPAAYINNPSVTPEQEVAALEDAYMKSHGKYLQILPGNVLPSYEIGTVAGRLGKNIPDNMRVDIYETPTGIGYQITYVADGVAHSTGAGPEASARSYTLELPQPPPTATSTAQ